MQVPTKLPTFSIFCILDRNKHKNQTRRSANRIRRPGKRSQPENQQPRNREHQPQSYQSQRSTSHQR